MINYLFYFADADFFFGDHCVYTYESYIEVANSSFYSTVRYPFENPVALQVFCPIVVVLSFFYLFGIGGNFAGIFVYYALFSSQARNPFILDGSDNVIMVTFPFILLCSNSIFHPAKKSRIFSFRRILCGVGAFAIQVQICIIYFATYLAEIQGKLWLNGTATYYVMRVKDFSNTQMNIALTKNLMFVTVSTYFTLLFEGLFAFLIWIKSTRYSLLLSGVLLHVGIYLFMRIDNFSWVMIASYFVFVPNSHYRYLRRVVNNYLPLKFRIVSFNS